MINYSIVMRPVNANLFQINAAKGRINKAKKENQTPDPIARHIASHGCVYSSPSFPPLSF